MTTRLQRTVDEIQAVMKQLAYHGKIVLHEWHVSEERS